MAGSGIGRAGNAVGALLAGARYEVMPLPDVPRRARAELPRGATVTVTASPSRGPSATVAVVEQLAADGFDAVPHLAARSVRDEAELSELLARLAGVGVRDVFVVGGDAREPVGRFTDALDLLQAIERLGRRPARIGVASYPDGHHRIGDATLWASLRTKQDHADYTVTQLCFDAAAIGRFAAAAREHGIHLPLVAGVPGVVDTRRLLRAAVRVGVGDAMRFARSNPATAGSLLRPGAYRPTDLVRGLAQQVGEDRSAIAGLHLYTFNEMAPTVRWLRAEKRRAAA